MKTEAELKMEQIETALNGLMTQDKLKADVAYTHLTNIIKWLIATIIIMFVTIFGSVIWFLNTFDIMTTTETVDINAGTGTANYIEGEGNEINNGKD
jgi:hypothetical protein